MPRIKGQVYLTRLDFIRERARVFDLTGYDASPDRWSRQMKSLLTQEYNKAQLANATDEYADQHDYKTMAKLVRPFAKIFAAREGYRLDKIDEWKPAQKAKLTRYYKKAIMLASKQFELYHSNDAESMERMADLSNQKGFPEFNQVFYPAPPGSKIHYNKKTNTATATGMRSSVTAYYWEQFGVTPEQLIADPAGVVKAVVAQLPQRKFSIKAGEYSIGKGVPLIYLAGGLSNKVAQLIEKYSSDVYDPNNPNSHYWGNWLTGIDAWEFEDRIAEQDFITATRGESDERRRYKRALRKRLQYAANKYQTRKPK